MRALRQAMPAGAKVTGVADRGFGNRPVIQCLLEGWMGGSGVFGTVELFRLERDGAVDTDGGSLSSRVRQVRETPRPSPAR